MESRKSAIIDALVVKADALVDEHLAVSTQEIPKSFRHGLNVDVNTKNEKTASASEELTKKRSSVSDFQVILQII